MDEAADVDVQLQRAVDNLTAAATPCELPYACPVTALDDIVTHIGGEPSGIAEVLHSVQQTVCDAMPAPMAEALNARSTRSVAFGHEPLILQPAGSAQTLRRAQPIHPLLLPEQLPMQASLPSSMQQQQQQQQQQACGPHAVRWQHSCRACSLLKCTCCWAACHRTGCCGCYPCCLRVGCCVPVCRAYVST